MDIKNHNRSRVCNQMMKCKWCIKVCVTVWHSDKTSPDFFRLVKNDFLPLFRQPRRGPCAWGRGAPGGVPGCWPPGLGHLSSSPSHPRLSNYIKTFLVKTLDAVMWQDMLQKVPLTQSADSAKEINYWQEKLWLIMVWSPQILFSSFNQKWNETFKSKILLKLSSTVLWEI